MPAPFRRALPLAAYGGDGGSGGTEGDGAGRVDAVYGPTGTGGAGGPGGESPLLSGAHVMIRRWLVLATGAVCALAPIVACAFAVGSSGRLEGSGGPPANVTHPAITNCCTVGNLASVAPPTWDGSPTGYTYQWQGGSSPSGPWATIPDASESAYAVQTADVGSHLSAVVTATNSQGPPRATSNEASPAPTLVSAAAPVNVEQPQIIGLDTVTVGGNPNTLTAKPGTWSGPQPITYTYG
jgi:hypothetical protein